jgi:AcrR family transcriptional regulator
MVARAARAEATADRILDAGQELFGELLYDQVSLEAVAERAAVTVRTVIRRFGSKERLFTAVADRMSRQVRAERETAAAGGLVDAVGGVIRNYERWGDHVLHYLAQESRTPSIAAVLARGRAYHHSWVERTFGQALSDLPEGSHRRRLAQLVVVTDIYAWKLLRRDLGATASECELQIRQMATMIVSEAGPAGF